MYIQDINIGEIRDTAKMGKRAETAQVIRYLLDAQTDKVLALQGLPETGQDQIIAQVLSEMSDEMIKHTKCFEVLEDMLWTQVYSALQNGIEEGYKYFFIKNVADFASYQYSADSLFQFAKMFDVKIVIWGNNPAALLLRVHDENLDEKLECVQTTYVSYDANLKLLNANSDQTTESYMDYLRLGPVPQRNIATEPERIKKYINHVSADIIEAMKTEYEFDGWGTPLPEKYDSQLLQNMVQNRIYKSVADVAYDCICYALMRHCKADAVMELSETIQNKINEILEIPQKEITITDEEIQEEVFSFCKCEKRLFTPVEIESQMKKTVDLLHLNLAGAMQCATIVNCVINAVDYDISEKDSIQMIFQNTGFLHALVQFIFFVFQEDVSFTNSIIAVKKRHHNFIMENFWDGCNELLLCRLATHNLVANCQKNSEKAIGGKIQLLKYGFWNIVNIIDEKDAVRRIVILPAREVNGFEKWDLELSEKTKKLYGKSSELFVCRPEDAIMFYF